MSIESNPAGRPLTNAEYLQSLPARERLAPHIRKRFDAEAIASREAAPLLLEFERATRAIRERAQGGWLHGGLGPFLIAFHDAVHIPDPSRWTACEGCGGTGVLADGGVDGPCDACGGDGYRIGRD